MRTGAVLRCLAAVADEIHTSHSSAIRVIPVVGVGITEHEDLFQATAESLRACYIQASDPSLTSLVSGAPNPAVVAAIDRFLSIQRPGGPRKVQLVPGREIDVEFDDGTRADTASTADRQILALARAFLTHQVTDSPIVFISYDETLGMDRATMRASWDFLVGGIAGLLLGRIETVVAVVNVGSIDVGRHCRRSSAGFRFGIEDERLLQRTSDESLATKITRIRNSRRPLVFFLGAGFSASSGLPLGNSLRDSAIRALLGLAPDATVDADRVEAFRRWCAENHLLSQPEQDMDRGEFCRTLTLEQVVRIERDWHGSTPTLDAFAGMNQVGTTNVGTAVRELTRILALGRRVILLTVNFDTLVETTSPGSVEVFAGNHLEECADYVERYINGAETAPPYLKLHGTIDDPETCVVTDDATRGGLPERSVRALESVLAISADLIYVGASMRDRDLTPFFMRKDVAENSAELWVSPYVDDNVWHFVSNYRLHLPRWRGRLDPYVVTETADVFLTELASALA